MSNENVKEEKKVIEQVMPAPAVPLVTPRPAQVATPEQAATLNAVVEVTPKPRKDPDVATAAEPSTPPPEPKLNIPDIFRMGALRDLLRLRHPKSSITIRLDVTSSAPGTEFLAYVSNVPAIPTGVLAQAETLMVLEQRVKEYCSKEVGV